MFHTYAQIRLQGYVGSIREVGKSLKVRISNTESWKDREDQRQERTFWNTVTLFERTPGFEFLKENLQKGDLVMVEGKTYESSYERDGQTVYETTLAVDRMAIVPTNRGA